MRESMITSFLIVPFHVVNAMLTVITHQCYMIELSYIYIFDLNTSTQNQNNHKQDQLTFLDHNHNREHRGPHLYLAIPLASGGILTWGTLALMWHC